jgi:hypothetical protein
MGGGGELVARWREDGEGGGSPVTRHGHEDEGERGGGGVVLGRPAKERKGEQARRRWGSALLNGDGGEQRKGSGGGRQPRSRRGRRGPDVMAAARNSRQRPAAGGRGRATRGHVRQGRQGHQQWARATVADDRGQTV